MNKLDCPVDLVTINENKARINALLVLLLTIAFLITGWQLIIVFLIVDFALRTFRLAKYIPLAVISEEIIKRLKISFKPTDQAPKRFAAGVGLVFTAAMIILLMINLNAAARILAVTLVVFVFLESALGFCTGCYVYTLSKKLFNW